MLSFFPFLYFQLSVYMGEVRTVAIKIDQACAERKLFYAVQENKAQKKLTYYLSRNNSGLFKVF